MPMREYQCQCGHTDMLIHGMDEGYPQTIDCEACGGTADYKMGGALFRVDFKDGWDDGAGEYFPTKRDRDNFLAENGLRRRLS